MSNELIYAMSTLGQMKLEEFNNMLNSVSIAGLHDEYNFAVDFRQHIIRLLDNLGYCEFDFDKRKIFMCPPTLVRLPGTGLPKAVLVGARIPKTINRLKSAVKSEQGNAAFLNTPQKFFSVDLPPLICIEAESTDTIKKISLACGISCDVEIPASWKLASLSAEINKIKSSLNFTPRTWAAQKMRIFDVHKLRFTPANEEMDHCLTDFLDPITKQHIHWVWGHSSTAEINIDWGRYVMLDAEGRNVLLYDKKMLQVAVPEWVPLPSLMARSLTLCTGFPPEIAKTGDNNIADIPANYPLQIYSGVDESLARLIATKLHQNLYYHKLTTNSGRLIN